MDQFTLIIYGLPGGGKGTQGKILRDKFEANYLCSGDIVREMKEKNTPLGRKIKARYDQGIPQPDHIIIDIFQTKIADLVKKTGNKKLIIDGFPKSLNQAQALEKTCQKLKISEPYFIYLDIDEETVFQRISSRLFCSKCGSSYLPADSEFSQKICSRCQGQLQIRSDDQPEVVKNRLADEKKRINVLNSFYQAKNRLITVDGRPSISQVAIYIEKALIQRRII